MLKGEKDFLRFADDLSQNQENVFVLEKINMAAQKPKAVVRAYSDL